VEFRIQSNPNNTAAVVPETEGFRDPGTAVQVAVQRSILQYACVCSDGVARSHGWDSGSCQMDRGNGS
jgi:hypothetical protein